MIGQRFTELAHESGNALQCSHESLCLLALEVGDRPGTMEMINNQQRALDDLTRLYEEVWDHAVPIVPERRACELPSLWQLAWDDLKPARASRRAVLREDIACSDPRRVVDPHRMGRVFRNLLENALAACPVPAEIVIRCATDELDGSPCLRISVSDNGAGITPLQRSKVFEAFYMTKKNGTGLGLAICRRILEEHGGWIVVSSRPGHGAEFILNLPRGTPELLVAHRC